MIGQEKTSDPFRSPMGDARTVRSALNDVPARPKNGGEGDEAHFARIKEPQPLVK